jgi:hypothetical protein
VADASSVLIHEIFVHEGGGGAVEIGQRLSLIVYSFSLGLLLLLLLVPLIIAKMLLVRVI